jgi:hypothetical protein
VSDATLLKQCKCDSLNDSLERGTPKSSITDFNDTLGSHLQFSVNHVAEPCGFYCKHLGPSVQRLIVGFYLKHRYMLFMQLCGNGASIYPGLSTKLEYQDVMRANVSAVDKGQTYMISYNWWGKFCDYVNF